MNLRLLFTCFLFTCFSSLLSAAPAPDFTVTSSDNQTLKLYQDYISQGKVVVIEMFFTTCPPCNVHAPHLQTLYTQMQAQFPGKVEFILLSTLGSDTNIKVGQYKTSKGLTMPAVGADGGSMTALQPYTSDQFGEYIGTPTFIVIAPNTGEVFFDIRGGNATQTMTLLSEQIEALLPTPPCTLQNPFGESLEDVRMHITGAGLDTTITYDVDYDLSNMAALSGINYTLTPAKIDNPLSGVTTFDLVLISKHILGIEPFLCDWQKVAADVNCSNSITTLDIVTARKMILGIETSLPCGSYQFIPKSATAQNGACSDFTGVKIADVNAGVCDGLVDEPDDRGVVHLQVEDRFVEAGETIQVSCLTTSALDLEGFQLALDLKPGKVSVDQVSAPLLDEFDADCYTIAQQQTGVIPMIWVNGYGKSLSGGAEFLNIQLTTLQAGYLSDMIGLQTSGKLAPQIFQNNGAHPVQLSWINGVDHMALQPNPASHQARISVFLTEARECRLQLIDLYGKTVQAFQFNGVEGRNEWPVALSALSNGLYTLQMEGCTPQKIVINR